jgi:hypothetical protein
LTQPARPFRLDNDPRGSGLSCDETGLRLAGVPLLREAVGGFAARAPAEIAALLACAYGDGPDAPRLSAGGLETVARALNQGDLAKAMTAAVFLRLPELDPNGAARIVHAEALLAKWDGQPHDADGRFGQGKMSNAAAHQNRPPTQSTKPSGPAPHVQGQTISHVATAADFATPKTPANAPGTVQFSPALQSQFSSLWRQSFPGGNSMERGGTIMSDRHGNLSLQNVDGTGGDSGHFQPNLTAKDPVNDKPIGTFHTHPYTKSEMGGPTGVSFSGADVAYLIDRPIQFLVVQSGKAQFLLMKTGQTQPSVNPHLPGFEETDDIPKSQRNALKLPPASLAESIKFAKEYKLAFYRGENGHFTRVYP